jgi:N-acyl-D-amino-acid deacylase
MKVNLLIKGGRIVDGTGNPWFKGDIYVKAGKILKVGKLSEATAEKVIEAGDNIVSPGFIDAHSHSDFGLTVYPYMESTLTQGITTVVAGQCGSSPAPINPEMREFLEEQASKRYPPEVDFNIDWTTFGEYLELLDDIGTGANIAQHVGHGTIRTAVIGLENRKPSDEELQEMVELMEDSMRAGAFGLSTGLIYPPGMYATTEEIIELAKIASKHGGVYDSHIRGEGNSLIDALKEAIEIGEKAKIPVQISHHKAAGKSVWGKSVDTLSLMEEARSRGVEVTCDQYPYEAGSTSLSTLLPPWAHDGGTEKLLERLGEESERKRMRRDIQEGIPGWENFVNSLGWANIMISYVRTEKNKVLEGKNIVEAKLILEEVDEFSTLFRVISEEEGAASMVIFSINEEDIHRIMKHPLHMVGTDASSVASKGLFAFGKPHPRHFGTYPRILGRYVRQKKVLRLEEAIRKMTSFPAQKFGLTDRGVLRPGMWADIVVFNPETIIDKATYQNPHQLSVGIEHVIVNGEVALENGNLKGILPGKTLRNENSLS